MGTLMMNAQVLKVEAMSKPIQWKDFKDNRVSKGSMTPFQTLTIQDGETIRISVTWGINNQRCLIQISLVLQVSFNQELSQLISLNMLHKFLDHLWKI